MHSIDDKMVSREARRMQHSVEERPREPSFSGYVTEFIDAASQGLSERPGVALTGNHFQRPWPKLGPGPVSTAAAPSGADFRRPGTKLRAPRERERQREGESERERGRVSVRERERQLHQQTLNRGSGMLRVAASQYALNAIGARTPWRTETPRLLARRS